ncbi:MAG: hypothetical protein GX666_07080 [Tissierellia bacterium]|nr:hypothetical protein [Tissierellia bacterium]
MKKYILIILSIFILTSCNKTEVKEKVETETSQEEIVKDTTLEEKKYSFELQNGEKVDFDEMKIFVLAQDIRISAVSLDKFKLEILDEDISDYINLLSTLNYKNSKDSLESALDEETVIIYLDEDKYIEMIESRPYTAENLYYYNYYENGELKSVLTSEIDIKSKIFEIEIENRIKTDLTKEWFSADNEPLKVYSVNLVDRFYEGFNLILLSNVFNENFSFSDGIFNGESGFASPMELRYEFTPDKEKSQDKSFEFSEFIQTEDGSGFAPSLEKMSRGNSEIYDILMSSQNSYSKNYDKIMNRLFYLATKNGLENFSHKIEEVPGYESDVIYIESGPNHIDGTVEIAKRDEYEKAKKNEEGANWPHCEGVIYHKETGIAVKTFVDYFE